jgi:hypothetical protein
MRLQNVLRLLLCGALLSGGFGLSAVLADDDFFGDTLLSELPAPETKASADAVFTASQPLTIGGAFRMSIDVNAHWKSPFAEWTAEQFWAGEGESSSLNLGADLFFSGRPYDGVRYYGKFKIDYPFSLDAVSLQAFEAALQGQADNSGAIAIATPNIRLWELYADFAVEKTVNVRAGKQMAKWGVGYFFRPADILSLSPVDPEQPELDREGPIMVKANLPLKLNNVDAYLIVADGFSSIMDLAYAARLTMVLGGFELGIGGRYQYIPATKLGSPFQAIATASGSLWKFDVFGEALLAYGSSRRYLEATDITSGSVFERYQVVDKKDVWFPSFSLGLGFEETAWHLSVMAQYYFNGTGYGSETNAIAEALLPFYATRQLAFADLSPLGQHYGAAYVSYSFASDSPIALSMFWMGNLQDASGYLSPRLSIKLADYLNLALKGSVKYGSENSEYGFSPFLPRMSLGFELDFASGIF